MIEIILCCLIKDDKLTLITWYFGQRCTWNGRLHCWCLLFRLRETETEIIVIVNPLFPWPFWRKIISDWPASRSENIIQLVRWSLNTGIARILLHKHLFLFPQMDRLFSDNWIIFSSRKFSLTGHCRVAPKGREWWCLRQHAIKLITTLIIVFFLWSEEHRKAA